MWFEEAVKEARKGNKGKKITVETDNFILSITDKSAKSIRKIKEDIMLDCFVNCRPVFTLKDLEELELAKIYSNKWEIINE